MIQKPPKNPPGLNGQTITVSYNNTTKKRGCSHRRATKNYRE